MDTQNVHLIGLTGTETGHRREFMGAGITTTEREHADLNTITVTYTLRVI